MRRSDMSAIGWRTSLVLARNDVSDPNRTCGLTFDCSKCVSHARDADVGLRAVNARCGGVLAFHLIRIDLARILMR
jgi:hypothetical protein